MQVIGFVVTHSNNIPGMVRQSVRIAIIDVITAKKIYAVKIVLQ